MAVAFAPVEKRLGVCFVARHVIKPAGLVLPRNTVALDVIEMRTSRRDDAALELDDARLDDDAARSWSEAMARLALAHGAAAATDPVAGKLAGRPPRSEAALTGGGDLVEHAVQIGLGPLAAEAADTSELGLENVFVVIGHGRSPT